MLSIGHTVEDPSGVRQSTIYLCCDTSSDKFGKLLLVRAFPGEGGQACGHVHWCGDLSLVGLLDLLVDVADDPAPAKAKGKGRVRAANRPHHTPQPPPGLYLARAPTPHVVGSARGEAEAARIPMSTAWAGMRAGTRRPGGRRRCWRDWGAAIRATDEHAPRSFRLG